jgi:hypothetical protein
VKTEQLALTLQVNVKITHPWNRLAPAELADWVVAEGKCGPTSRQGIDLK